MKKETIKYCACGCGEIVTINKNPKIINRFIKGHQNRGVNYFGYLKEAPLCACGCKEEVTWNKTTKEWNKYVVRSHNNRSENYLGFLEVSPFCICGCGEKTTWNKKRKVWNKYVTYHNFRGKGKVPWNKDKKGSQIAWNKGLTKETSKSIAIGAEKVSKYQLENPREPWNKGLTKEDDARLENVSKLVSKWFSENPQELTEKQLNGLELGRGWDKGLTKETDERIAKRAIKIGKALKGRKNPEHSKRLKELYRKHPEKHINYILGQKANGALSGKTYIEKVFGEALEKNNINAEYNYHVGKYWIDYGIPDKKIGFECDGEFWHKDKEKDRKRDSILLNDYGWKIYRFTGKEINSNMDNCISNVKVVMKTG